MYLFLKFIFGIELYMFRTVSLYIIRSLALYTQQCADCLLAGSGCSILIPLASSQHNLYDINLLLCNFFIITNLIHKFLVHSHKLHKIKFLYMFRAQSAHDQEVNDANCTYAASGIVTYCK